MGSSTFRGDLEEKDAWHDYIVLATVLFFFSISPPFFVFLVDRVIGGTLSLSANEIAVLILTVKSREIEGRAPSMWPPPQIRHLFNCRTAWNKDQVMACEARIWPKEKVWPLSLKILFVHF